MAGFSGTKCSTPGCDKDAVFQCPRCLKLELINKTYFCSQICFNNNWKEHKTQHVAKMPFQLYVHDTEAIHRWAGRAYGDVPAGEYEIKHYAPRTTPDSNKDEVELSFYCRLRQCIVDTLPKIYIDEEFYTRYILDRTYGAPTWNEFKASSVRNISIDCGILFGFVNKNAEVFTEELILQEDNNVPLEIYSKGDPDLARRDRQMMRDYKKKNPSGK